MSEAPSKESFLAKLEDQRRAFLREYIASQRHAMLMEERAMSAERRVGASTGAESAGLTQDRELSYRASIQALTQQNERLHARLLTTQTEKTTLSKAVADANAKIERLETTIETHAATERSLRAQRTRDERQLKSLRSSVRKLETELITKSASSAAGGGSFIREQL